MLLTYDILSTNRSFEEESYIRQQLKQQRKELKMKTPWFLKSQKVTKVIDKIASRTTQSELHSKTESLCDEIWRKGDVFCHKERQYYSGCADESCSLCRPNN
jgi:hypothetical protein